jgi:hypothetical protein
MKPIRASNLLSKQGTKLTTLAILLQKEVLKLGPCTLPKGITAAVDTTANGML